MKTRPLFLYRAATGLIEPLAPVLLKARARKGKEEAARLGERLGAASVERPDGQLIWLHGASVGEGLSLLPLVGALRGEATLLVTTGTAASAKILGARLPENVVHQYAPIDAPDAVARFLDHWRPDLAVFVESELWPNLIAEAKARNARLALLSARLSKASLKSWGAAPATAKALLSAFDLVMAQDDATAGGLAKLGARDDGRLNLKLAAEPLPVDEAELERVRIAAGSKPTLVAASTHPGEEPLVLEAYAPMRMKARLVIAPRHPPRGLEVASIARGRGFTVRRQGAGEPFEGKAEVYVADALGELGLWFRLGKAAFIGGSLVAGPGGHNPLEPALLRCPVISGRKVSNWTAVYAAMQQENLCRTVADVAELQAAFSDALAAGAEAGQAAQQFAKSLSEEVKSVADRLLELIR